MGVFRNQPKLSPSASVASKRIACCCRTFDPCPLWRPDECLGQLGFIRSLTNSNFEIQLECMHLPTSLNKRRNCPQLKYKITKLFWLLWRLRLCLGYWRFSEVIYWMSIALYHFHFRFAVPFDIRSVKIIFKPTFLSAKLVEPYQIHLKPFC